MSRFFKESGLSHPGLDGYCKSHTKPQDPLLAELFRDTYVNVYHPRRSSDPSMGKFLEMVVSMVRPFAVLEIGTFTGYGTLSMAAALQNGATIDTIEINDELAVRAREWFDRSPQKKRINLHIGDALQILPLPDKRFDLAFIDGDKDQYIDYYDAVMGNMNPGGFIIADNTLWGGKVFEENPASGDHFTRGVQRFNRHVMDDPRVDNLLLPLFDGITLIRLKP